MSHLLLSGFACGLWLKSQVNEIYFGQYAHLVIKILKITVRHIFTHNSSIFTLEGSKGGSFRGYSKEELS